MNTIAQCRVEGTIGSKGNLNVLTYGSHESCAFILLDRGRKTFCYFTVAFQFFVSHYTDPSLTYHEAPSCSFFCAIPAPQSIFLLHWDFYYVLINFYSHANQKFKCHVCMQFLLILFLCYISAMNAQCREDEADFYSASPNRS